MIDLNEIAKHCEEAAGPDRSIDGMIAIAVGATMPDDPAGWPPRYTASIDAALTLVPKGFASAVGTMAFEGSLSKPWGCYWEPNGTPHTFEAATPALALCAAALRAAPAQS